MSPRGLPASRRRPILAVLALSLAGCGPQPPGGRPQEPAALDGAARLPDPARDPARDSPRDPALATRAMAERLAAHAGSLDPRLNPFDSEAVVAALERSLAAESRPSERARLTLELARHLINASRTAEAREQLDALLAEDSGAPEAVRAAALDALALSWLRQGELDNCVTRHGVDACKFPVQGDGRHVHPEGSRQAMTLYRRILHERPEDLAARWLLNVAAQTLGEWPEGVEERWRIGPEVFASEGPIGRFRDVAGPSGAAAPGLSGGAIIEDFDGDGLLDLMASSWGARDPLRLLVSVGDGTFADRSAEAGLSGLTGGLNLVHADYDGDGDADVFVTRGAWLGRGGHVPNSLLRNDGTGRFDDVTEQAGLLTFRPTQVAAWADYDGDGRLDLFVGNESTDGDPHPSELWHQQPDGTFRDASASFPGPLGFVKGAAWGDFDDDGDPDLYVTTLGSPNLLLRNDGPGRVPGTWTFTNVAGPAGVELPLFAFPTWFFDFDNDGRLDLFAGGFLQGNPGDTAALYLGLPHHAAVPRLYRNRGDGTFEDVTVAMGLARVAVVMGANWGDLDGDGWQDIYLGTGDPDLRTIVPNRLFRNDRGRSFQDVTTASGMGHLQKGHGVAFGDLDGDGDLDVYQDMGGAVAGDVAFNALYENPGHGHAHVTLRLVGTRSPRCAIGARIRVRIAAPSGARDVHVLAGTGGSFGGSSLQQEIGLGDASAIDEVEIRWPGTSRESFAGVTLGGTFELTEGSGVARPQAIRRLRLAGSGVQPGAEGPR